MVRSWIVLGAAALIVAGCKSDDPTGNGGNNGGSGAGIVLQVVTSNMVAGTTQQLQATVRDTDGKRVTNPSITWSVTPASVATVSATGTLSAVAPGTAQVTARSGNATTTINVVVAANPCTTPLSLAVGDVRQFTGGSAVACVTIAQQGTPSEYIVIGSNVRPAQDDLLQYTISPGGTSAAVVSPNLAPAPSISELLEAPGNNVAASIHQRLRAEERRLVGPQLRIAAQREAERLARGERPNFSVSAAVASVGDTITIKVPNLDPSKQICRDAIPVRAVVRTVSQRATIMEDVTAPTGGFTAADFNAIAAEFDNVIFPTDTAWFGRPTDINSDARITILYTPEVNKLAPASTQGGFTAGFFFGNDLLRKSDFTGSSSTSPCRDATNEQEVFYLLSPDPTGQYNNVRTTATVRQGTRGVIAHEFQHMINQSVRQYNPAVEALETTWLNEAMSHLAEEIVGRAIRGFGDFQSLNYANVNPDPASANDYNAFFRQNLLRFRSWMQRPDTSAPVSAKNAQQLAPRGASWAFLRYLTDHYANGSARAFTRALAVGPQTDVANVVARVRGPQFDELVGGWLVANYADNLGVANLPARYSYTSWDMRDAMSGANNGTYPLLVQPLAGPISTQVLSSSGNYYRLSRAGGAAAVQVRMLGAGGSTLTSEYATLIIARVN